MSTWLYLECLDHDPPLRAAGESGQHLSDLHDIRADIAIRDHLATVANVDGGWIDRGDSFRNNTLRFLLAHPRCRLGIRDEYGYSHPITEEITDA